MADGIPWDIDRNVPIDEFELKVGPSEISVTDERLSDGKVVGIRIDEGDEYENYITYVELDFPQLQRLSAELTRRVEKGAPRG